MRDAENEKNYGEFSAREGDIVAGVIQRDARANARGLVVVRVGSETKGSEGVIPAAEQVPGENYDHGDRLRCYVVGVSRGAREPLITLSRTHPNLVRKLFSLEVPEIAEVDGIVIARLVLGLALTKAPRGKGLSPAKGVGGSDRITHMLVLPTQRAFDKSLLALALKQGG